MPSLVPFRALRFDPAVAGALERLVCPPYDVISPEQQRALLERDPHNLVRIELPPAEPGDAGDERYERAAEALLAWQAGSVLAKDPAPSVYPYEQRYRLPDGAERVGRGFFARLRLEPYGAGIRPHERTMGGPKEDRYRLLRATGANLSPILFIHDGERASATLLDALTADAAVAEATDDDGVQHRVWRVAGGDERVAELLRLAGACPLTIADGHHRYETALRYRDECLGVRVDGAESSEQFVLALVFDLSDRPPSVLATHRLVVGGLPGDLLERFADYGALERLGSADVLVEAFPVGVPQPGATPRIGVLTREGAALLRPDPARLEAAVDTALPDAVRALDVSILAALLQAALDIDPAAVEGGGRLRYTKDPKEAVASVASGEAAAAFLLDPTPLASVVAVASAGGVMPQKSTYFHPKPPSGLVISPPGW
ncbi:MAG TPA: DUF1015 domain-containing protein [Candidatus Limnocylindrales bacterium]|nr:DUF1015 domain-containing protein [Candidatus Limnocylindrales bacterium]